MVRHGTLKKRRSGRKVTRKAPKHASVKIRNALSDPFLRAHWDISKSPKENMLSMGLNPHPNETMQEESADAEKTGFMGFMTLPTGNFEEKNPARKVLSRHDQEYLLALIAKHGLNFKKMSHDLVTNHLQHTEQKLEKMYEKYNSLTEQQKVATPLTLPAAK
jgi:hypothetical protein